MEALLTLLGLLFLLATTVSAAILPSNATTMSNQLLQTYIVAREWEEEPFPQQAADVEECAKRPHMSIGYGLSAITCMCFDNGFASMHEPMVWAIEEVCSILVNTGLGPGGIPSQSFTLLTTHWDIPVSILAKVYWAGRATGYLPECEEATLAAGHGRGIKLEYAACYQNFVTILDDCNSYDYNGKQGGFSVDKCFIYWLDPNNRATGE